MKNIKSYLSNVEENIIKKNTKIKEIFLKMQNGENNNYEKIITNKFIQINLKI